MPRRQNGSLVAVGLVVVANVPEGTDGDPDIPENKNRQPEENQKLPKRHNAPYMGASCMIGKWVLLPWPPLYSAARKIISPSTTVITGFAVRISSSGIVMMSFEKTVKSARLPGSIVPSVFS